MGKAVVATANDSKATMELPVTSDGDCFIPKGALELCSIGKYVNNIGLHFYWPPPPARPFLYDPDSQKEYVLRVLNNSPFLTKAQFQELRNKFKELNYIKDGFKESGDKCFNNWFQSKLASGGSPDTPLQRDAEEDIDSYFNTVTEHAAFVAHHREQNVPTTFETQKKISKQETQAERNKVQKQVKQAMKQVKKQMVYQVQANEIDKLLDQVCDGSGNVMDFSGFELAYAGQKKGKTIVIADEEDLCEHKRLGHNPMFPDCRLCQLANKRRHKHTKSKDPNKHRCVLTLDLSGKLPTSVNNYKYFLAGSYTPPGGEKPGLPYVRWLKTKSGWEVRDALQNMISQINASYAFNAVYRIHSDAGTEFLNESIKELCNKTMTWQTHGEGDDPQTQGQAEQLVHELKAGARVMLKQAELSHGFWPYAVNHKAYILRQQRQGLDLPARIPTFGDEVVVRKRYVKTSSDAAYDKEHDKKKSDPAAFKDRGLQATYLGVCESIPGGAYVRYASGAIDKAMSYSKIRKDKDTDDIEMQIDKAVDEIVETLNKGTKRTDKDLQDQESQDSKKPRTGDYKKRKHDDKEQEEQGSKKRKQQDKDDLQQQEQAIPDEEFWAPDSPDKDEYKERPKKRKEPEEDTQFDEDSPRRTHREKKPINLLQEETMSTAEGIRKFAFQGLFTNKRIIETIAFAATQEELLKDMPDATAVPLTAAQIRALHGQEREEWHESIMDELNSLRQRGVYTPVKKDIFKELKKEEYEVLPSQCIFVLNQTCSNKRW